MTGANPTQNPARPARTWHPTLESLFDCWQNFFLSHRSPDTLDRDLLNVVAEATQADRASLMRYDPERRQLRIAAAIGIHTDIVGQTTIALGDGIAGWVALNRRPLLLPNGPDVPAHLSEYMHQHAISSALCVPMVIGDQLSGVLNLARQGDSPAFTSEDLWFAALIAERQAAALQTAHLYDELANSERFINRIVESVPISLVVIDRKLQIVSANRNFLTKTRHDPRQTIGRPISQIFPSVLIRFLQLEVKISAVFASGHIFDGEKMSYRAPGLRTRTYYYRLIPIKSGAQVEHVLLLMEDITEREQLGEEVRRAERYLASVIDWASDLVVSMTPQGDVVTWNRAAERVSGLTPDQVRGKPFTSLCVADQRRALETKLRLLMQGEESIATEIALITSNPQQQVEVAWNCSAMHDDTGAVVALVAVGRDLTERRRLEAQLAQSAKMASLGVMAGGIAHEIRNPLAIIAASAQLLEDHPEDAELRQQCTQKILTSTQRASLIIEHLLKFAHPPQDRFRLLNIHATLEETFTLLGHQMRVSQVALQRDFSPDVPRIYGNPELLQQVFTNLILNACNAMPEGGQLTVVSRMLDDQIELRFSDSGHGIDESYMSKIFDPFFTTRTVGKGTGLGLSISYSIVQQHHGTLEVMSDMGHGATFIIRLPVGT
ncbi:PAS domain-containing protein [Oscillochloris sp. ZM17-4]|uniref:PAS domain-containing protein n=1 Tax=Oscillochloris sp. ZM17-4 TaxID=2866714 RepID=UPI001C72D3F8|nr:PAS domain-containing protein [Oscillochloris sp. ZM17-4]MBX0329209.1 PAS domain-containing protein [Oscillochloris sp. ZM17-4]